MKHTVHTYVVARICVHGVEAESQEEAVRRVDSMINPDEVLKQDPLPMPVPGWTGYVEYADETVEFLVDEEGDEHFERSTFWRYDPENHRRLEQSPPGLAGKTFREVAGQ